MSGRVTMSARALVTAVVVAVAVVVAYLVGHAGKGEARAAEGDPAARTVTVQGVGHVSVVPDQLAFSVGVTETRPELEAALDDASAAMTQVVDTLVAQGVDEKDVQTTDLSMYPVYSRKPRALTGFRVDQSVSVVVRDLDHASEVISAVAAAGGSGVHLDNLRLQVSDPESSLEPARSSAFDQAKAKAEEYAGDVGAELGEVVRVTDVADQGGYELERAYSASDSAAAMPLSAGQADLTATVTVVFELR